MKKKLFPVLGLAVSLSAVGTWNAYSDDYSWNATSNANWGTQSNWRVSGTQPLLVPGAADNITSFNDAGTGALQINGSRSINNIIFDNNARDVNIINASAGDMSLTIGGTLSVNSTRSIIFRGTSANMLTLNVANFSLTAGNVNFGNSTTQILQGFSSTGSAVVNGGTASFLLANSGTASFNDLTVNAGVINISSGTGAAGLSATSLSGTGGVIQTQAGSSSAIGHLVVGGSGTSTYGGVIANGGSSSTTDFTKVGAGLQILTGANTYTGGTTISAGTLQVGNGGTTGSLTGGILNNAALNFNRSDSLTYSGVISGTGSVSQIGTGATVLTGSNTFTGVTNVNSGTLQIGNGGSGGHLTGDINVQNGAAVVVARTGTFSYNGAISGTNGVVTKLNSGTWLLNSASTFSGTTEISSTAGNNITLGNANALQNSTVRVLVSDGLRFSNSSSTYTVGHLLGSSNFALNNTDGVGITLRTGNNNTTYNASYTGDLSGLGGVEKIGTGAQRFTGNNTYSGGTVVTAGTLLVNNTAGSGVGTGAVSVKNSATLGGLGYVVLGAANSVTVESGGRISAGTTSIGTLTFDFGSTTGGLAALDGSAFAFDLGVSNTSDLVRLFNYTSGDFTLGTSVALNFSGAQIGEYTLFSFYTDAGSTLYNGAFSTANFSVTGLGGFTHQLNYANGLVTLSVVPEPGTFALLGLAGMACVLLRRRRSTN